MKHVERRFSNATTLAAGTFAEGDVGRLFENTADGHVFRLTSTTPTFAYEFSKGNATEYAITYAATITPNMLNGPNQKCTLTGNVTVAVPTNGQVGSRIRLRLIQDATGSRVITLAAGWHVVGGAPTESTTAARVDILEAVFIGSAVWQGTFGVNVATS